MGKKYTEEFLLSELRRFYDENGRSPTSREFDNNFQYPSSSVYKYRFGSWNDALIMVDLKPADIKYIKTYSKDFLIKELQRFYKENNKSPRCVDLKVSNGYPSYYVYSCYFNSFNDALIEAGLNVSCLRDFSRDFLINELQRFYEENNRNPTVNDLTRSNGYPSLTTYYRYFESLESALLAANLNTISYNRETLISDIHKFIDTYGRVPTSNDLCSNYNMHSSNTYTKEFGTWNNALIAAGIDINKYYNYDKEFLLNELKRFYNENGVVPKSTDLTASNGYPSIAAYIHNFGSFNIALTEAELNINKIHKYDYTIINVCTTCGTDIISNCNRDENGNIICRVCWTKIWRKNNYDKFLKSEHKRRGYGFTALNKKYKGSHAHHLHLENRTDFIIYIPNFLHELYYHNHEIETTMITPNAIALDYLINEDLYNEIYYTGGE